MSSTSNTNSGKFIAHRRKSDGKIQEVHEHLLQVADLTSRLARKIGLAPSGELIGLLHDLGKYASGFQNYFDPGYAGGDKVDHSTAGAQFLWRELNPKGTLAAAVAQAMALCIASHHGGLIDCLSPEGEDRFNARMLKHDVDVHLLEVLGKADACVMTRARQLLGNSAIVNDFGTRLKAIIDAEKKIHPSSHDCRSRFLAGLLVRALFSCLIDADRIDTSDFEDPARARLRPDVSQIDWEPLIKRLESHLLTFEQSSPVDVVRGRISDECRRAAAREKGVFTLTVPTGGGKSLASLRFALHHAKRRGHSRIIYVVPYTTIIDQNAQEARNILEGGPNESVFASVVLEHHSNLTPEEETPLSKLLSENWGSPVVYTTMVQLLESLFGSGTRGARRMHQLANAVIIFDEIQALPVTVVHLFCNAVNFLAAHCGATVVLCTATQPLLALVDPKKGAVRSTFEDEIIPDIAVHFDNMKRVEVLDRRKVGGWSNDAIIDIARASIHTSGSCLVVVNTKRSAFALYEIAKTKIPDVYVCHLSTSMCPAHRVDVLEEIYKRIGKRGKPPTDPGRVLCISTQLIEAGVDVDFGSVVRFTAGLDSIAQAAGRCNRHGRRNRGLLTIVNPIEENLDKLVDIRLGRDVAIRVLDEFASNPSSLGNDLLSPVAIDLYFRYYFFARSDRMDYRVDVGRDDTLLNLLSENTNAYKEYERRNHEWPKYYWRQSFKSGAEAFKAIDAPTRGVIVPYDEGGRNLIGELCATTDPRQLFDSLRKAQRYAVNVFDHTLEKLKKAEAVHEVQVGTGVLYIDSPFYSTDFGLDVDGTSDQPVLIS